MQLSLDNSVGRRKTSSERLQRAIERNRSKQSKRQGNLPSSPKVLSASTRKIASSPEETTFDRELRQPRKKMPAELNYSQNEVKRSLGTNKKNLSQKSLSTPRKRNTPVAREVGSQVEGKIKRKFVDLLAYAGWICCLLLLVRLVVADRGVWHYYNRLRNFNQLQNQFVQIQDENQVLVEEIELISSDRSYQKKLIRDNLGFISSSEYLLLFSGKRKPTSI